MGALLVACLALVLVIAAPPLIAAMGLGGIMGQVMSVLRWPLLALVMMLWLAVLYRYGPGRGAPKWRWVTWGSAAATVLWLIAFGLFSIYVAYFTGYGAIYGPAGAVIILLIWLYIGAYAVLLGAELNAEMEHQTAEDTTSGPERPMGSRGAHVADSVGDPLRAGCPSPGVKLRRYSMPPSPWNDTSVVQGAQRSTASPTPDSASAMPSRKRASAWLYSDGDRQ